MEQPELNTRTRTFSWQDPSIGAKVAATMSGLDYMQAIKRGEVPPPPIAITLNMNFEDIEEGRVVFTVEPQEYHYNPIGMVHGGLLATLCDSAMGCAVHTSLPKGTGYSTLEIKVNYIKALTIETGKIYCEGKVINVGGRVATAEARVVDSQGTLYGHATTTCIVLRPAKD
jgi:uncharacterized protein (TIGR00369 family)